MLHGMKAVCSAFLIISICVFASISSAGSSIYTIEGDITAVFPSQPQLIGELQTGGIKSRTFQAVDVGNKLTYSLTLQTINAEINERDIPKELRQLAKGDSLVFSGNIVTYEQYNIHGYFGAKYEIHYSVDGVVFKKNTAVTYYGNRFVSWSITEINGLSTESGKYVFDKYIRYFKVTNEENILSQKKLIETYISKLSTVLPKKINDKLDLVSVSSSGSVVIRKYVYWGKYDVLTTFEKGLIAFGTADLKYACTEPTLKELLWSGLTLREEIYDIEKTLFYSAEFSSLECPNKF